MNAVLNIVKNDGTPPNPGSVPPITCTVEVVTPMFLAGADNRALKQNRERVVEQEMVPNEVVAREGLRSASVKAALRFWWRAGQPLDLDNLRRGEADLFGCVADGKSDQEGQGAMVRTRVMKNWTAKPPPEIGKNELSYLAYGCADLNQALRPAVVPGAMSELTVIPRHPAHIKPLSDAIERWLLFGNLGAKSRRGWGSLSDSRWKTRVEIEAAISRHLIAGDPALPLWSSMQGADVLIKEFNATSWDSALNEMGRVFHQFRKDLGADVIDFRKQSGDPQRYAREPGKDHHRVANWLNDHGMRDFGRGDQNEILPDRVGFGLPYPMQFGREKPLFEPAGDGVGDRRASPLIIKIHKVSSGFVGLMIILGGRFLPAQVKVQAKAGRREISLPVASRPQVLSDFSQYLTVNGFTRITP